MIALTLFLTLLCLAFCYLYGYYIARAKVYAKPVKGVRMCQIACGYLVVWGFLWGCAGKLGFPDYLILGWGILGIIVVILGYQLTYYILMRKLKKEDAKNLKK